MPSPLPRVIEAGPSGSQQLRARRKLFASDPSCYWCAIPTQKHSPDPHQPSLTGVLDPRASTLDHLLTIHQRDSLQPSQVVLACHACNQFRARLHSYRWRAFPLRSTQVDLLLDMRQAYLQRALPSAPGFAVIASEYAQAVANLAATCAILESPQASSLEPQTLAELASRLSLQQALPALLFPTA